MLRAYFGTLVAMLLLYVSIDLLTHRQPEIVEHDVPAAVAAWYYVVHMPEVLIQYQVAALAALLATLLVLGSCAQHNEFTALFSAGIPLRRIVRAPLLLAASLCVTLYVLSETVGPPAAQEARSIEELYFGKGLRSSLTNRSGVSWVNLADGWKCHVTKFNRIAMTGEDVLMSSLKENTHEQISARRIFWDEQSRKWLLEDGAWSVYYLDQGMARRTQRISQMEAPIDETPEQLFAQLADPSTRTVSQLSKIIADAQRKAVPTTQLQVNYHGKFAAPVLPLTIVLLSIPFATRLRRGGVAIGAAISIALGLGYLVLFSAGQALGYAGQIPPWLGAWLANIVFLMLSGLLFSRAST